MRKQSLSSYILLFFWLGTILLGFFYLNSYSNQSNERSVASLLWPQTSLIEHAAGKATLLIFMHPQCPCSSASLEELNKIMTKLKDKLKAYVVFVQPETMAKDLLYGSLWKEAHRIKSLTVIEDFAGIEAKLFNARTSGEVVLYDSFKNLIFSGGITWARGHSGDNFGASKIESLLKGENKKALEIPSIPVLGCALFNQGEAE